MLNYQATSNLLGNSYAGEEGIKAVNETNPVHIKDTHKTASSRKRATLENLKALNG